MSHQSVDADPSHTTRAQAVDMKDTLTTTDTTAHGHDHVPEEKKKYPGSGTADDPFIVDWDEADPENPRNWTSRRKWILNFQLAFGTFIVAFGSSLFSGALRDAALALHTSETVTLLGISLYVLGFGVGPLFFAPLSEMYGRRVIYLCSYTPYFFLHLGGALAPNIQTLVVTRFLAGTIGSAPFSNAGGQIGDVFAPKDRGNATALYSMCVFFGPILGPIIGGFVSQYAQWRDIFWILFTVSGFVALGAWLNLAETYPPVLLRWRARKLQKASGGTTYYSTEFDRQVTLTKWQKLSINLKRPILFLLTEPTVTFFSLYIAAVYGTLYASFSVYPIVFQDHHGFTVSQSGLAFLGMGIGMGIGMAMTPVQRRVYAKAVERGNGSTSPEARLYFPMIGGCLLPIGLFWFAWTTGPSIPWIVPIIASAPFGMGMFFIFNSVTSYLMDSYGLYSASALASTVLLRSLVAAAFPLFSPPMFTSLGDQWGMSIFAFISVALLPVPIVFFKFGHLIRQRSKYAIHGDIVHRPPTEATSPVTEPVIAPGDEKEDRQSRREKPPHPQQISESLV